MLLLRPLDKSCNESPCEIGFVSAAEPIVEPRTRLLVAELHALVGE